jgi:hypothetical protein|tara:strand:- start:744 stop:932 length:189 start_codon:yes stop_codon:yes gene_type:complete
MALVERKSWEYDTSYSYEANQSNWIDAVNFERKQYKEVALTQDQAEMKFKETYPKEDYDGQT